MEAELEWSRERLREGFGEIHTNCERKMREKFRERDREEERNNFEGWRLRGLGRVSECKRD